MQLEENKSESSEKVELVRELIIGPDKKAIEAQITGMRELFTSILIENRREYERQVGELKNLFVSILEENRNSFREQLRELQASLPKMVQHSVNAGQKEGYVVLADEARERQLATKYTKIEAVKEIILGQDIDHMYQRVNEASELIESLYLQQQQTLVELSKDISEQLNRTVEQLNAALDKLVSSLEYALQQQDSKKSYRSVISSFFEEAGKRINS